MLSPRHTAASNSGDSRFSQPGLALLRYNTQLAALCERAGVTKIAEALAAEPGRENHAHLRLVGGAVRSVLLNQEPRDFDVRVNGTDPSTVRDLLERIFPEGVHQRGKGHPVITARGPYGEIEISVACSGDGGADCSDFTCNDPEFDPLRGLILASDASLEDLRCGRLEVTDPERFSKDPVQLFRGMQLVARTGLVPSERAVAIIEHTASAHEWSAFDRSRVHGEFIKLLQLANEPSKGIRFLEATGVLKRYFPELAQLRGCLQDPIWHPEGDVLTHSLAALDSAAQIVQEGMWALDRDERLQVMWGTLLHDAGKPATTTVRDGRVHAYGHESAGVKPSNTFLKKVGVGEDMRRQVGTIVEYHMKPTELFHRYEKGEINAEEFQRLTENLVRDIKPVRLAVLVTVALADRLARGEATDVPQVRRMQEAFGRLLAIDSFESAALKPLLVGADLIRLGISEESEIRDILKWIGDRRSQGTICDTNKALEVVRQRFLVRPADLNQHGILEPHGRELAMRMVRERANDQTFDRASALRLLAATVETPSAG